MQLTITAELRAGPHQCRMAVPTQEAGLLRLTTVLSSVHAAARLAQFCVTAAGPLLAQVAASYFVPFCLSAAAVVSRLRILACTALARLSSAYTALVPVIAALPRNDWRTPKRPGSALPEMVRIVWPAGSPVVTDVPFECGQAGFAALADEQRSRHAVIQSAGATTARRPSFCAFHPESCSS